MPPRIPSGPPLSSRAVLAIGGLALLCLTFLAALTFTADSASDPGPLRLDAPVADAAHLDAAPEGAPTAPSAEAAPRAVFTDEPQPIPATVLAALEQAAEEPLDVELSRLLDALQHGFSESSVQVEPTLRPYAFRLAGRLNIRGTSFRVRVAAPDPALAAQRAETLRRLFEAAGVVPGRLQFTPRAGAPGLTAEPA